MQAALMAGGSRDAALSRNSQYLQHLTIAHLLAQAALMMGHLLGLPPGSAGRRLLAQTLRDIHGCTFSLCSMCTQHIGS